jgi:hypothetical protein
MGKQDEKVKYNWKPLLALCNRMQNVAVIRTSPATFWGVGGGRTTDSVKMTLPVNAFTNIESDWLVARKSNR